MAWNIGVPGAGHPFRTQVAESILFRRSWQVKCSSTATIRMFGLTTEPYGPGNPDTEDPLFQPARPSYSRGLVCSLRCSDAPGGRPDPFAPNPAPSAIAFSDRQRAGRRNCA